MRYSNEFTLSELKNITIGNPNDIDEFTDIYMQGKNWGSEDMVGTREDWEKEIPEEEEKAKSTGFYDWYQSDERYLEGMTWGDYRDELLDDQLVQVKVID